MVEAHTTCQYYTPADCLFEDFVSENSEVCAKPPEDTCDKLLHNNLAALCEEDDGDLCDQETLDAMAETCTICADC